ncbi:ectoine dioxygenase-like [Glandiceps talaboti]
MSLIRICQNRLIQHCVRPKAKYLLRNVPRRLQYLRSASSLSTEYATGDVEDHYPTRVGNSEVLQRFDPITWNNNGIAYSGPLTQEQLNEYDTKGYLVLEKLFTDEEMEPVVTEVQNLKDEIENGIPDGEDPTITNTNLFSTEPTTKTLRSIFAPHQHFPLVDRLSRSRKLISRIQQILADDVYIHQSRINFHQAFVGVGHNWHNDFEIFHAEDGMPRMRALSGVVMLSRNVSQNGALMVVPGSHHEFTPSPKPTPSDQLAKSSKAKIEYGAPNDGVFKNIANKCGIDYCTGDVGSVILFDVNLLHGNHSNISPWHRINFFAVYNALSNKLLKPYSAPWDRRPEHMGSRDPAWVKPIEHVVDLA